ncbi:SDR family oxidoreductase [Flavisolibacter tropicus]|uniref:NmrA family transcriptional regulator n=1 Tax=Flavisolibacter tropicus TaxID=1492898 RepID=A0A172TUX6_9BACT|nr:SDR family oxidoreductase [Flavisolibacter tropicus]ANE50802.1 NmrA family transcriptional regulator [Flavisolibacter tropicus]
MKIVVIGGTGLIGSKLVNKLRQLDHTVIAASPQSGVNTITGEGLNEVLKEAVVVVDVSNSPSFEDKAVLDFFQQSTTNLLKAEANAGVKHHVALSVVGAERLPGSGYLRAKVAQENLIKEAGIPYSILRSTQFFEFAGRIAQEGVVGNEVRISTGAIQPIASDETVAALADIVINAPVNAIVEVGGPERMPMSEFIRYYLTATEDSHQLIPDAHALYFGVELDDAALITGENARLGKIKYEDWFSKQLVNQS